MSEIKLKYNTEVQVSQQAYNVIMNHLDGVCAGREENDKFFIKCFLMGYKNEVKAVIKAFPLSFIY